MPTAKAGGNHIKDILFASQHALISAMKLIEPLTGILNSVVCSSEKASQKLVSVLVSLAIFGSGISIFPAKGLGFRV